MLNQLKESFKDYLNKKNKSKLTSSNVLANPKKSIGLCIQVNTSNKNYNHLALYFPCNNKYCILDLGWHNVMNIGEVKPDDNYDYYTLIDDWEEDEFIIFSSYCLDIFNHYQKGKLYVPYAVGYEGAVIHQEPGLISISGLKFGLTCATFIVSLLVGFDKNLDLIKYVNWQYREDDKEFHEFIMYHLEKSKGYYNIPDTHISNVRSEINCARIRPEDVASACIPFNKPIGYYYANYVGRRIHTLLRV